MPRNRRNLLIPLALSGALFASACASSGGTTASGTPGANQTSADNRSAKAGGTLILALAEDPDALDPTLARTLVGREVFVNMCEKLYDIDENLNLVPQLAAALPETSADGTAVTIKLRSGVLFNDGTKFDAQAVKTTLDRDLTLKGSARTGDLANVKSIEVVDPSTVKLTLSGPYAPLTAQLADRAGMIMSPAQLQKLGDQFGTNPVCVGPFSFVSRSPGNEIVLKKSTDYYDASKVKLDGVTYKIITDSNVRLANLKSGDVQAAERLAATDASKLKNDSSVQLISRPSLGYQGITINIGNVSGIKQPVGKVSTALGSSPQLRQAFELSLDRDVINQVVFAGQYQPGCSPLPPVSPFFDASVKCPARDLKMAKQLIAQSGVPTPVPVTLTLGTSPDNLRLGQVVQAQAKEAGFNVTVAPTEFTTALDQSDAGKFDTFQVGWSGRIDPDGNTYNFLHTGAPLNIAGESDPQLDKDLEQARAVSDMAQRKKLYSDALAIASKDRPIIYLYYPVNFLGLTPNVTGVQYFADGLPRLATAGFAQ